MQNVLGRHLLVEFYNCHSETLNDMDGIERIMNQAALDCGATIVQSCFHRFEPHGVSGVVVIAESHLAIHTWPEFGYASVDLYTCGDEVDPLIAYEALKRDLQAQADEMQVLKRGNINAIRDKMLAAKGPGMVPDKLPVKPVAVAAAAMETKGGFV